MGIFIYIFVGFIVTYSIHIGVTLLVLATLCYGIQETSNTQEVKNTFEKWKKNFIQMLFIWLAICALVYIPLLTATR